MRAAQLSPSHKAAGSTPVAARPGVRPKPAPEPHGIPLRVEDRALNAGILPRGLFNQAPGLRKPIILGSPHHAAEQRAESLRRQPPARPIGVSNDPLATESSTVTPAESGFSLTVPQRRSLEPRFDFNFANIRIHTTPAAEQAAQSVGARAFSLGQHLVFARGQYAPGTQPGNDLLAHELADVVDQQSSSNRSPVLRRQLAPGAPVNTPTEPTTASPDAKADSNTLDPQTLDLLDLMSRLLSPGRSAFKIAMDLSLLPIAARLAWELAHTGLFGPVMEEAIAAGLLPALELDFFQRTALQIQWFLDRRQPANVFFYLNGLWMIDMIDVLRLLPPSKLQELEDTFVKQTTERAAVERSYSADGLTRFETALGAVKGTSPPTDLAAVPENQQQAAQGFRDLPHWLNLLPRAIRDKKKKQGITPNTDPSSAKTKPLIVPDQFTTAPSAVPPAEAEAIVTFIRRNRERLTDRIASEERSATGFSHGGSLSKDARPSALPARDALKKTRPQMVDEAIFAELGSEGSNASVNTADTAILTLGKGLANGPSLTSFMLKLFETDPAFKTAFSAAGVTLAPDPLAPAQPAKKGQKPASPSVKWFAVNTEQGVVEEGDQALQLIRLDSRLQSIFIDLAESDEHKQGVADAQWSPIMGGAAVKFNAEVREKWPLETIRGCAHFVHWGAKASWPIFQDNPTLKANPTYGNALHVMIDHLIANSGYVVLIDPAKNIRMVKFRGKDRTNPSITMMNFADKFAITSGIVVPVAINDEPNSIYFDFFDADSIPADKPKKYLKLT